MTSQDDPGRFEERLASAVRARARQRGELPADFTSSVIHAISASRAELALPRLSWSAGWQRWATVVAAALATLVGVGRLLSRTVLTEPGTWSVQVDGYVSELLASCAGTDLVAGALVVLTIAVLLASGLDFWSEEA